MIITTQDLLLTFLGEKTTIYKGQTTSSPFLSLSKPPLKEIVDRTA